MNSKHTPGQWDICMVDFGASDDEIVANVGGCAVNICSIFGAMEYSEATPDGKDEPRYEVTAEEASANARLIAAAPELLAALRKEEEWREREAVGAIDEEWDYEIMVGNYRRAAIAKAEGRA